MDKNLPASAGDTRLIPGLGRFHTLAEQQNLRAAATEPAIWSTGATTAEPEWHRQCSPRALKPVLGNKRSHRDKKLMHGN